MSRKTDTISDEQKLALITARTLHDHLASIGKASIAADLTEALKPFEAVETKAEERTHG